MSSNIESQSHALKSCSTKRRTSDSQTLARYVDARREGRREGLPEIQLPWKQQGTISIGQAPAKLCLIEMWVCMEEEETVKRKERKEGCYHGNWSAEGYIKAVNEAGGLELDHSVGVGPQTAGHAHDSLRGWWKPSNASLLLFFLLLQVCCPQQHKG
ncbi:uncharacterized [Tachysurus ichikawai]